VPELTVAKDAVAAHNAATCVRQCHLSLYRPVQAGQTCMNIRIHPV